MTYKKLRTGIRKFARLFGIRLPLSLKSQRRLLLLSCAAVIVLFAMAPHFLKLPNERMLTYAKNGPAIAWLSPQVSRWNEPIDRYAQAYNLDPDLIAIIMTLESNGDPAATSRVGAQGLMQVMPMTGTDIARKFLNQPRPDTRFDLYDPATSIEFGAAYLAYLRDEFGADARDDTTKLVELVAAGYNGGPGTAGELLRGGQRVPENINYSANAVRMWLQRDATTAPPRAN